MNTSEPRSEAVSVGVAAPTVDSVSTANQPVASAVHTIGLLVILACCAYATFVRVSHLRVQAAPKHLLYLPSIALEWAWFGYVFWSVKKHGTSLRELIGPRWSSAKQVFTDIGIAIVFQFAALTVLFVVRLLLHAEPGVESIRFLAPVGVLEIVMWILLSLTAGIVEETVFRGYLQRQFVAWTGNATMSVLISAAFFGAGHIYQGGKQAIIIGVYGALFGALSLYRRSLKPGMIAHAIQDAATGVLLSLLIRYKIGGM